MSAGREVTWKPLHKKERDAIQRCGAWWAVVTQGQGKLCIRSQNGHELRNIQESQVLLISESPSSSPTTHTGGNTP